MIAYYAGGLMRREIPECTYHMTTKLSKKSFRGKVIEIVKKISRGKL